MASRRLRQVSLLSVRKKHTSSETTEDKNVKNDTSSSAGKKYTFFYQKQSPFSQHHMCKFTVEGVKYNCAEQYMMHQKAILFKDNESAKMIMKAQNPVQQKSLGRKVRPFDASLWNSKCESVVKKGNIAKFTQNSFLRDKLLKTAGTVLVEASPRDRIWGIGMSAANPAASDPSKWRGKNLLGKILTEVREELLASELTVQFDDWDADDDATVCK